MVELGFPRGGMRGRPRDSARIFLAIAVPLQQPASPSARRASSSRAWGMAIAQSGRISIQGIR
jgi:hypothetical protein